MEPPVEPTSLTPDKVQDAVRLLESLVNNRLLLQDLDPEQRKALLMAAGRVSRPERIELIKVTKQYRREMKKKIKN